MNGYGVQGQPRKLSGDAAFVSKEKRRRAVLAAALHNFAVFRWPMEFHIE
jgi:hypothetical protein